MSVHSLAAVVLASILVGCAGTPANPRNAVDSLFRDYDGPDRPGASVVVIHDGQVVLRRAYGLASLEKREPATPDSNYRLASLSKQFTATAILLLVQEGRLRLDDRVADVLPGFPPALREVCIQHLLQHTSGLWDYEDFVPATQPVQVKDRDVLALVSRVDRTYFPPGTAVRYSNSGYAVLALVVEQVSGVPFARFLHERVFVPGGMRSTVAHEEGVSQVSRRAYGYAPGPGGFVPRDQSPTSAVLGDGGIYASVVDLVAWDRALDTDALLRTETRKQAWTPPVLPDGTSSRYGFGWFVDDDGGRRRLSHHGETCGFTNAIVKYPEQRLTVIVLTNRAGGAPWTLAQGVADLWLDRPANRPWPFETLPNAH
ncbi:beta-lactamase family protein [Corallococcus macrosporus]|uniref:Beta-lactamase family protein n=1 Tax=Corallococcus macrosporus TaxID=35 RepID=A0ABS3D9N7_9BACT|nr:serine hydrolase domain-containing protein [Corallococcus macrosporus]MBN8227745.1 beta-lactamase family protein [Corallococcus macrosporus]